jgi:hypothetical protein
MIAEKIGVDDLDGVSAIDEENNKVESNTV